MWKYKLILNYPRVVDFLNENNIKPENCKITESEYNSYYLVFYYVDSKG